MTSIIVGQGKNPTRGLNAEEDDSRRRNGRHELQDGGR